VRIPKVISVKAINNYQLSVVFDDGLKGVIDVSHLTGKGVFEVWERNDTFKKVYINSENGAISWPGEADIDTLNVYCTIKGITPQQFLQQKEYASNQ